MDPLTNVADNIILALNKPNGYDNIIHANYIGVNESSEINKIISFAPDENLIMIYFYNGRKISGNVLVGITNVRLFKIEKNKFDAVNLSNIKQVNHRKNDIFRWDKIECKLHNNKVETFGVYHKKACGKLCEYLNTQIKLNNDKIYVTTPPMNNVDNKNKSEQRTKINLNRKKENVF